MVPQDFMDEFRKQQFEQTPVDSTHKRVTPGIVKRQVNRKIAVAGRLWLDFEHECTAIGKALT